MRSLEKLLENSQFVHQLESGGMYRVTAKIAQKVLVLLKNEHVDARASEKEAEHHSGRTAARNATASVNCLAHNSRPPAAPSSSPSPREPMSSTSWRHSTERFG